LLIDNSVTGHPSRPQSPRECHLYLAEGCHLYIALTQASQIRPILENFLWREAIIVPSRNHLVEYW
jgi:hypothetical protein